MKALVTGAAGFIGSTLVDKLLSEDYEVVGIDSFTPYYDVSIKRRNISNAVLNPNYKLLEIDLSTRLNESLLDGVTHIFHQAGQPGVRASWGAEFNEYVEWNVKATQNLLELASKSGEITSFVAASSSSVYGNARKYPTSESDLPSPVSPYGVTKLAAENLCTLYGDQFGLPTISLRYFTVFGPRQRPDMAMRRIIDSVLTGSEFVISGNGEQIRDFTYVDDVIDAIMLSSRYVSKNNEPERTINIGGGQQTSLLEVIEIIERISNSKVNLKFEDKAKGDPRRTGSDSTKARRVLGWHPQTTVNDGMVKMIDWVGRHL
jgi:UDP-glucuronate 4-epimerase